MNSSFSSSELEETNFSKLLLSGEELEFKYLYDTVIAQNIINSDLIGGADEFDPERDVHNMPKALKTIDTLKKQNHALKSRLMVLTRDVPFMKALSNDQKVKLIIKLRLHMEKLISKCNQLHTRLRINGHNKEHRSGSESTIDDVDVVKMGLQQIEESSADFISDDSLSISYDRKFGRLLDENRQLRESLEKAHKSNNEVDENNKNIVVTTDFQFELKEKADVFRNESYNNNEINELKIHVIEMKRNYEKVFKKHIKTLKELQKSEAKVNELSSRLNAFYQNKMNY
uniref:Protein FAM33A n=1 Tax=Rhabditophanes sp. KR3021 TaxID=114890 RepID=A0AC35TXN1_9BILA